MEKVEIQGGTVPHSVKLFIPYILEYNKEPVRITQISLREITGKEEEILLSRRFDFADKFVKTIASCITEIKAEKKDGTPVSITLDFAEEIVKGLAPLDKTHLYIVLRVISLGEEYEFEYTCSNPDCQSRNRVTVNLLEDVRFVPPKEIMYQYDLTLPSGKKASCRIPLGRFSDALSRITANDPMVLTKVLMARLVSLDGKDVTLQEVQSLSLKDRNYLFQVFDEKEGVVESDIEVVCPKCTTRELITIDFSQISFFYPGRAR